MPDDQAAIEDALRELAPRSRFLLATGGLGPTRDDLTRHALAALVTPGEPMVSDQDATEHLRTWFAGRTQTVSDTTDIQTLRPRTATMLRNVHGTAFGLADHLGDCRVWLLPGPPREMQPMFETYVRPELQRATADRTIVHRTGYLQAYGIGESSAAEAIEHLMSRGRNPLVGITAGQAIVFAHVRAHGEREAADALVEATLAEIEAAWQPYVFTRGEVPLAEALGQLLAEREHRLVTAESCTGGWIGKALVDIPGSSRYYDGGWVTYSNNMKTRELGVDPGLIAEHGAVSAEVAAAMARGALQKAPDATRSVAVTGVAGPDGTPEKPAGLVYISVGTRDDANHLEVTVRRFRFTGDRTDIRDRTTKTALQMVRLDLLGRLADTPLLWESSA